MTKEDVPGLNQRREPASPASMRQVVRAQSLPACYSRSALSMLLACADWSWWHGTKHVTRAVCFVAT